MTIFSFSSSSSHFFLLLLLSYLLLLSLAAAEDLSSTSNGTTIYDLLPQYGLPPGLLPNTVKSFSLSSNGSFSVDLEGPCYVDFEYLIYYETKVSGIVRYGGIEDLKGVKVRRFLIWLEVDAIKVDLPPSQYIYFQVGWITRKLTVEQFQTVHSCDGNKKLLDEAQELFDWSL